MPRLNSEERAHVLARLECRRTQEQVAGRFNLSRLTIRRLVRRVRVTGTFADRPRSGRPRVMSVRQDNFIRPSHLCDRFVTAESTSYVVVGNRGRPISRYTVRRGLRERGITCRRRYLTSDLGSQPSRSALAERGVQRLVAFQLMERRRAYPCVQATSQTLH